MSAHTAPPVVASPPGNPRFPLMHSCARLAVLGVLFGHVGSLSNTTQTHSYGAWIGNLTVGVALFFVLSGLAAGSVALRAFTDNIVLSNTLPTYFYWFALGMGLAVLSVAWQGRSPPPRLAQLVADRPDTCWAFALIAYLAVGAALSSAPQHVVFSDSQLLAQHVLRGVVAVFFILPAVLGDWAGVWPRRVLGLRWLGWVGLISYGLYLWHFEIILVLAPKLDNASWPLLVSALVLSVLCAAGSYYLVKRPILRFKDLRGGRRTPDKAEGLARVAA